MAVDLAVVLIENVFEDGWFCLPQRHRNLAKNLMKLMENGTRKDYNEYINMYINFAIGYGKTPEEAYQDFHECYIESLASNRKYSDHIGERIFAKLNWDDLIQAH